MNIIKAIFIWLAQAVIGLAFIAFVLLLVAEWASGCGESYVDSKGVTHVGECIFFDRGNK